MSSEQGPAEWLAREWTQAFHPAPAPDFRCQVTDPGPGFWTQPETPPGSLGGRHVCYCAINGPTTTPGFYKDLGLQ